MDSVYGENKWASFLIPSQNSVVRCDIMLANITWALLALQSCAYRNAYPFPVAVSGDNIVHLSDLLLDLYISYLQ